MNARKLNLFKVEKHLTRHEMKKIKGGEVDDGNCSASCDDGGTACAAIGNGCACRTVPDAFAKICRTGR